MQNKLDELIKNYKIQIENLTDESIESNLPFERMEDIIKNTLSSINNLIQEEKRELTMYKVDDNYFLKNLYFIKENPNTGAYWNRR